MENIKAIDTTYIVLPPNTHSQRIKILVVDKDESVLKQIMRVLTVEGYEVETTSDPVLALEKTKKTAYDILISEVHLAKMDGLGLAENIIEVNPELSVLFMSEQTSLETAKLAFKAGACYFITKPLDSTELLQTVKKAIKGKLEETKIVRAKEFDYLAQLRDVILKTGEKKSIFKISLGFALRSVPAESGIFLYRANDSGPLTVTFRSIVKGGKFEVFEIPIDNDLHWPSKGRDEIRQTSQPERIPILPYLLQKQTPLPWINDFCKPPSPLVFVPLTSNPTYMSAIILRLKPEAGEIKEYRRNLLYLNAQFTDLSLSNIELLNRSRVAYKELQYFHEQSIELERLASKGTAVAEIAHELSNLLTVIEGQVELSEKTLCSDNRSLAQEHLAKAKESLKKATLFVEGLQVQKKLSSERESCDLNQIIEEIVGYSQILSKYKYIEIVKSLDQDLPKIKVDVTQMKQVFYNLLNNATDAMGKRKGEGGKILLKTGLDAERKSVQVEIADTGMGISPQFLPYVLQKPFTTKSGGHGFGLVITKRIIDQHGGTIEIDSIPLQGTVVRLKLPVQMDYSEK